MKKNNGIYDFTVSGIDGNGYQYYTGMLDPERLDSHSLRWGEAFHFNIDHRKQRSQLYTFNWRHGVPSDWKLIANFKDEIICEVEVPGLLRKYNLINNEE